MLENKKHIDLYKFLIINITPNSLAEEIQVGHWCVGSLDPNENRGSGLYDVLMKISEKISKLRRDPRKGLTIMPHHWSGVGNAVDAQYQRDYPPYDRVDAISKTHDMAYHKASLESDPVRKQKMFADADHKMIESLDKLKSSASDLTISEKVMMPLTRFAISSKVYIDQKTYGTAKTEPARILPKKPILEAQGSGVEEYFEDEFDIDNEETFDKVTTYMKNNGLISVYWFDSFAFGPAREYIQLIDERFKIKDVQNQSRLRLFLNNNSYQNPDSVLCGHYVLFFLWCFFVEEMNFFEIMDILDSHRPNTDDFIRKWANIKK